jgi:ELWxxDGT repeat protein
LFFAAIDAETQELWKSDGTEAGTVMVRDMSSEGQPFMLGDLDGILYFDVLSGSMGHALWRSDGTEAGTIMLRPFPSGHPDGITGVRRTVFFMGSDRSHGGELWRSDGTPPGTVLVKDIRPGRPWSYPEELVNVGGTLYFKASDGDSGLWRSDGTARGTVLVTYYAQIRAVPEALTEFKGLLYFSGHACGRGPQLWRSNGTPRGTIMVKAVGHAGRCGSRLWWLTAGGDTLFFAADDDIHGRELWASDGTRSGTVMLRDIDPRWQGSYPSELLFVLS